MSDFADASTRTNDLHWPAWSWTSRNGRETA